MKNMKGLPLSGLVGLFVILLVLPLRTAHARESKPVVLRTLTFGAMNTKPLAGFRMIFDEVNRRAAGKLVIKYVGGPEAYSTREQGTAAAKGLVDMACLPLGFAKEVVKGSDSFLKLSPFLPWEERKRKAYDHIQQALAKQNLYFLGRSDYGTPFYVYTNVPIEKYEDISKIKIRCSKGTFAIIKGIGFVPVMIPGTETYTALERGVVDGLITVQAFYIGKAFNEITKYVINPPINFYHQGLIVNLNTWTKIPEHLRKIVEDVMVELEPKIVDYYVAEEGKLMQKTLASGVKSITLSPADAKRYVAGATKQEWENLKKANPKLYSVAREMFLSK